MCSSDLWSSSGEMNSVKSLLDRVMTTTTAAMTMTTAVLPSAVHPPRPAVSPLPHAVVRLRHTMAAAVRHRLLRQKPLRLPLKKRPHPLLKRLTPSLSFATTWALLLNVE